ncbi:AAA family ATPase [Aquiflexum lacus]|uniref:AAA family ATPase n=1 Tax=Aquiflexum lacus TaxID=2483805 RepID=UPI0018960AB3|nr:AAA family ATPase [Aquiflexum lacus]
MINKIIINKLYGVFNHEIQIKEGTITLILGENGLGKTVILKMIKSLFENDLYEIGKYDFELFSIEFDDSSILEINKITKESKINLRYEDYILNINYKTANSKKGNKFTIKSDDIIEHYKNERQGVYRRNSANRFYSIFRNFIPSNIERVGHDRWLDLSTGIISSTNELLELYSKYLPKEIIDEFNNKSVPEWFDNITKSIKVKLVETQRLLTKLNTEEKEYKSSVIQYSSELKEIIRNKTLEATNLSTKLDRTYTNRLIEKITSINTTSNTSIDNSLNELEKRRSFLIKVGLLEQGEEALVPINLNQEYRDNETLRDVLEIYIDDSNDKLSVYNELSLKLNTLIDIINKRFNYKKFSVTKNEGFVFKSTITNKIIPLSNLSSGEQHELVLFYELLFNTPENSLILIDEPEISLHITWQNEFINDLLEINKLNNIKSIIATHSPDIINNNWDLTIELK